MLTRRNLTTVDLPLGPGQPTIRLALESDQAGTPEVLRLVLGWEEGEAWRPHDRRDGMVLPAGLIPALREALGTLGGS